MVPPVVYLALLLGICICGVLFQKGCQRGRQQRQEMWHQRQERWDERRDERKQDRYFFKRGRQDEQPTPPVPDPSPDTADDQQRFFFRRRNK